MLRYGAVSRGAWDHAGRVTSATLCKASQMMQFPEWSAPQFTEKEGDLLEGTHCTFPSKSNKAGSF